MYIKNFSLISALTLSAIGLISLIPTLSTNEGAPPIEFSITYGMFLGLFPMNLLNKLLLVLLGVVGLIAYFSPSKSLHYSILFSKTLFWAMGLLTIFGLFNQTNILFGYWPLFGFNIILHATYALFGGYYGYVADIEATIHQPHRHHHKMHKV